MKATEPNGESAAPRQRPPRRPQARRLVLLGWLGLWAVLAYGKWGQWFRVHLEVRRAEQACQSFSAPPGQVVFEGDPQKAWALRYQNGYQLCGQSVFGSPTAVSPDMSAVWNGFDGTLSRLDMSDIRLSMFKDQGTKGRFQFPQTLYSDSVGDFSNNAGDIVFLHELKIGGYARLVLISLFVDSDNAVTFQGDVKPVGRFSAPPPGLSPTANAIRAQFVPAGSKPNPPIPMPWLNIHLSTLRVFAGQVDPNDPSRFSIGYELNGIRGEIPCQLNPDGTIAIQLTGPLSRVGTIVPPLRM